MAEHMHGKTWTPLRDYVLEGVRPPRKPIAHPLAGLFPSSWVSAWDYWVEGVRKPVEVDEKNTVVVLRLPQPKKPVPPEAWLTTDDVIADIQSVFARSVVAFRVEDLHVSNQQALEQGEISEEEWQYRSARLEEIQEEHFVRIEEIVQWYVDNFFRELDPAPADAAQH
ncbi:MAG: hypothetical protein H7836_07025 [Magnetococcus sp. YQC-3]